ncbi:MAG: hypothetical protein CVV51_05995 [Spirochaetae bacterium HGW-Spirochaetae-7]|nr:MAG: hypothetical protein CVV51_05995 [Spirochaetae bacterium HGW-Spirochaetae-7]
MSSKHFIGSQIPLALVIVCMAASCAAVPARRGEAIKDLGAQASAPFAAAGLLLEATQARRIPARKTRAMMALASPTILGSAIDMDILDAAGYPRWRSERRDTLADISRVRIAFSASRPEGGTERQSGMLFLPAPAPVAGTGRSLTWIVFLKGTEHLRDDVPSRGGGNEHSIMELAASLGYAVWAPDYAGMGDGQGVQEYCVPDSMAASALDGLAAARSYLATQAGDYGESGRLSLLGYSQGGFAVMATLAAANDELPRLSGLEIVAAYPMGAPLNLMVGVPFLTAEPERIDRPDYQILLILGWARAYPDVVKVEEILKPEIIDRALPYFDGRHDGDELCRIIARTVGKKTDEVLDTDLYLPGYVSAMRQSPATVPYFRVQDGTRLDRWSPPAGLPIILAATPSDELVRFGNSLSAYEWMRASNPSCEVMLVRLASSSHGRAAVEGLLYALVDLDRRERETGL